MNSVSKFASLFALAIGALGFAGTAKADFVIRVDNFLNPSAYAYASSPDAVEVCVTTVAISFNPYQHAINGTWCVSRALTSISGTHDFSFATGGLNDYIRISKVSFRINGANQLIVDQWLVLDPQRGEGAVFGVDNEFGWCLSTNSADFTDSHCGDFNGSWLTWTLTPEKLLI